MAVGRWRCRNAGNQRKGPAARAAAVRRWRSLPSRNQRELPGGAPQAGASRTSGRYRMFSVTVFDRLPSTVMYRFTSPRPASVRGSGPMFT